LTTGVVMHRLSRTWAVPDGVATQRKNRTDRDRFLARLGLPSDARLIGVVEPLYPRYRVKSAIWAFDLLRFLRSDVHLVVLGEGPQATELRSFVRGLEAQRIVHFLDDPLDRFGTLPLAHLDLVWSAFPARGRSYVLLEALAAGVPVVAADSPGNRELIAPCETGFLLPPGDRVGYVRHTCQLLDDAARAVRLGKAARRHVQRAFPPAAAIDAHAALYRELLG
jgi:glycosyltransferase involved in cell wall biosynthesis